MIWPHGRAEAFILEADEPALARIAPRQNYELDVVEHETVAFGREANMDSMEARVFYASLEDGPTLDAQASALVREPDFRLPYASYPEFGVLPIGHCVSELVRRYFLGTHAAGDTPADGRSHVQPADFAPPPDPDLPHELAPPPDPDLSDEPTS